MTVMRSLLLAALLLLPQLCLAQIYKTVDQYGNVSYSDTPPTSGTSEEVKLRETNSAPPPEMPEAPAGGAETAADDPAAVSYSVAVASPANETTIAMGPGNFSVSASVEPALAEGTLLQLFVDGTPSGAPQTSNTWGLTNVFRGAHDITVAVIGARGEQLASSAPVRVYVLRPSVNSPNKSRPRPTPH